MAVTEIAWFPFKPDTQGTEDAAALDKLTPELRAQPGLISAWQGAPLERPQSGEFVNVWESEEAYRASLSSKVHLDAIKHVDALLDKSDPAVKPYFVAAQLSKPFETVAAAPIVQVSSFFLPTDVDRAAFRAAFDNVVSGVYSSPPEGFVVGASGWALDEINGAKVFVALSGWESIEKRLAAHAAISDRFAEVQKFTNVVEVHHTAFRKAE